MTEQSYRDQFKEASAERHHKQKKVILLALVRLRNLPGGGCRRHPDRL
jgi:hypothetical protein